MFTGIIEEVGTVVDVKRGAQSYLKIKGNAIFSDIHKGDSIAVNGVCLTVTEFGDNVFTADVMNETLSRSSLGNLSAGDKVNLERAMAANGRFGGHIVSGHIDGMGTVMSITPDENAVWYRIGAEPKLLRYIVEKGSITVDGISLTVAATDGESFSVSIIPHTQKETALRSLRSGSAVNLETDIIGKYVEKLMQPEPESKQGGLTEDFLRENGFI
jgi:riboflavin synthase